MYHEPDPRRRSVSGALFFVTSSALLLYLAFAALHGEHGLLRLMEVEAREATLRAGLTGLRGERKNLAMATARLSEADLDLDLLDEAARSVLGLARPDELLVR